MKKKKKNLTLYKKFQRLLFSPFFVIREKPSIFIIWLLFTVAAGQFGIFANIIIRYYTANLPVLHSIYLDTVNGTFITFSIALVASLLGLLFINLLESRKFKFKTIKVYTIIASIFFITVSGVIYASIQSIRDEVFTDLSFSVDITTSTIYVISLIIVTYGYCVLKLESSNSNYDDIDDPIFDEIDDENVENVIAESQSLTQTESGVSI